MLASCRPAHAPARDDRLGLRLGAASGAVGRANSGKRVMITCQGRLPKAFARALAARGYRRSDAGAAGGAAASRRRTPTSWFRPAPARARRWPSGWRWRGGCVGPDGRVAPAAGPRALVVDADARARHAGAGASSAGSSRAPERAIGCLHRRRRPAGGAGGAGRGARPRGRHAGAARRPSGGTGRSRPARRMRRARRGRRACSSRASAPSSTPCSARCRRGGRRCCSRPRWRPEVETLARRLQRGALRLDIGGPAPAPGLVLQAVPVAAADRGGGDRQPAPAARGAGGARLLQPARGGGAARAGGWRRAASRWSRCRAP